MTTEAQYIKNYFAGLQRKRPQVSGTIASVSYDATTGRQSRITVEAGGSTILVPLTETTPPVAASDRVMLEQIGTAANAQYRIADAYGARPTAGVLQFYSDATVGGNTFGQGDVLIGGVGATDPNFFYDFSAGIWYARTGATVNGSWASDGTITSGAVTGPNVQITSTAVNIRQATVNAINLTAADGIRLYSITGGVGTQRVWIKPDGSGWFVASDKISWTTDGTLSVGALAVSATGNIRGGQTAYNTGIGFWLGYSSGYKFSIGDGPSGKRLTWDGTDLRQDGVIIGSVGIGTEPALQGWQMTCIFSSTDLDTVSWAEGQLILADGTGAYTIAAGNTGNMSAKTYIYWDKAVSTTAFQTTTTAATAIGAGKILIAVAVNGTVDARFQVFGGYGGLKITGGDIEAKSIYAEKLVVTAGGANLLLNSTFQVDANADGIADGWSLYNNSVGDEPWTAYSIPATGGVDNRGYQRMTWAVDNTTTKGVYRSCAFRANTTYVVSWWARMPTLTSGTRPVMELRWSITPSTTWLSQPVLGGSDWQRYAARVAFGGTADTEVYCTILSAHACAGTLDIDHFQVEEADTLSAWKPFPSEIEPGTIIGTYLSATAIDSMTITSPVIRTAASGARTELNSSNLFGLTFGGIGGYDGSTVQWYAKNSDGKLYAGGGNVKLDADGITSVSHTSYEAKRSFKFEGGGAVAAELYNYYGGANYTILKTLARTDKPSYLDVFALSPAGYTSVLTLGTQETGYGVAQIALSSIVSGHTTEISHTATRHVFNSTLVAPSLRPASDSTTALQLQNASGTAIVTVDTTNSRVGINDAAPAEVLDVTGNINATGVYKIDDVQVVSNRVIDDRCDDAINSGDATTDGVIDALRDAMIAHGLIAAA